MHAYLRAQGRRVGRHRIARLMRRAGLRGLAAIPRRVRTTDGRHGHPIAPNRLRRNFTAAAPNRVRPADPTYVRTGEGWRSRGFRGPAGATVPAHLAALIDMHTRTPCGPCIARNGPPSRFLRAGPDRSASAGWAVRDTLHADIALEALEMAVERQRPAPGLVHHSDRGVQYAADACRQALAAAGITPSMSRKGNCLDDAPMESFFHTLKIERVHHRLYATRAEARRDLFA